MRLWFSFNFFTTCYNLLIFVPIPSFFIPSASDGYLLWARQLLLQPTKTKEKGLQTKHVLLKHCWIWERLKCVSILLVTHVISSSLPVLHLGFTHSPALDMLLIFYFKMINFDLGIDIRIDDFSFCLGSNHLIYFYFYNKNLKIFLNNKNNLKLRISFQNNFKKS